MKIKGHELNDELVVEIGRFSVLWNCFERFQCDNFCSPSKIKNISSNINIDKDKECLFAKDLNNRRNFFNMIIADYVQEGLYPEGARQANTEEDKRLINDFLNNPEGNSTAGCLLAIYRIRNNLMHGLKQIEDLNNQLDLFKSVNEVLESIKEV